MQQHPTLKTLIEQLSHPDRSERAKAALRLAAIDEAGVLDALLDAMRTETDTFVREDITWSLVRIGAAAVEPLIELLKHADPVVRHHAAHTLGKIADARALSALLATLQDPAPLVAGKAMFAISQIDDARAVPVLIESLGHESSEVRTALMKALEHFDAASLTPLIAALQSPRWQTREHAADILGVLEEVGDAAIEPLIATLNDPQWEVRFAVVNALSRLASAEIQRLKIRKALATVQQDENLRVRLLAIETLRGL